MKLTNGEVFRSRQPLNEILSGEWPVKVSFGLASLASELNRKLEVIEKVKNGLINQYGTEDESGRKEIIFLDDPKGRKPSENCNVFIEELNKLFDEEVEIDFKEKIKIPTEVNGKEAQIKASILISLEKFVELG